MHDEYGRVSYKRYKTTTSIIETHDTGWDIWHAWERREKFIRFWWESQKERDHSEDRNVDERMGSEWILGTLARGV
jgi:hypothetical protein